MSRLHLVCCLFLAVTSLVNADNDTYFFNAPTPTPSSSYPARYGHVSLSCGGSLHLLGGAKSTVLPLNDVVSMTYDDSTNVYQWTNTTLSAPWPQRAYFGGLTLPDRSVVITNGYNALQSEYYTDLWYNPSCVSNGQWQQVKFNITQEFEARISFGFVYFQNSLVMIGGTLASHSDSSQSMYLQYFENNRTFGSEWRLLRQGAPGVTRGSASTVVYNDKIFYFAGYGSYSKSEYLNDVWTLASLKSEWVQLAAQESPGRFSGRSAGVAAVWQDKIIFTTGRADSSASTKEVWSYSSITQQWTLINSTSLFSQRYSACMVNYQGRLIITGGYATDNSGYGVNDLWISVYENGVPTISSSSSSSSSGASSSSSSTGGDVNTATTTSKARSNLLMTHLLLLSIMLLF